MLKAFFKMAVAAIIILIVLQLEYNGRKLHTYVSEYFKSLKGKKETVYIQEEQTEQKAAPEKQTEKQAVKQPVKSKAAKVLKQAPAQTAGSKKIKMVKEKADEQPEVSDQDRKALQQMLE
ncbi:MAG: hypothetical protein WCQ53_05580 [bacterium]